MVIVTSFWYMMIEIRFMVMSCIERWSMSALIMWSYHSSASSMYSAYNSMSA